MYATPNEITYEAQRRRTVAIIAHPDAGKSTLTEALLLHAQAIESAGVVHGKSGRHHTVSDWSAIEQARGISVTSSALQFEIDGTVVNLVDTPGHADFSEDTLRVLAVVDSAIVLLDAAKGFETQTLQLLDVCLKRSIPVIIVINKWDRPGKHPLELIDDIELVTKMRPMPITWPIGDADQFSGLYEPIPKRAYRYEQSDAGAHRPEQIPVPETEIAEVFGTDGNTCLDEVQLLQLDGYEFNPEDFLARNGTPVFFSAAHRNIGVGQLLDFISRHGIRPGARIDNYDNPRPIASDFSGYVFKIQSGMNHAHRDRIAFVRVCSGVFERGMVVHHGQTGRPFTTKYSQQIFGSRRSTLEIAWPGDVIGLVNATTLSPGDTLYGETQVAFPQLPHFAPKYFRVARATDGAKYKQFRRGLELLRQEGAIQVFVSEHRGEQSPILGAVGPLQFEIVSSRMAEEFSAPIGYEELPMTLCYGSTAEAHEALAKRSRAECEVVARADGSVVVLFSSIWKYQAIKRDRPELEFFSLSGSNETNES
ncbi:peptide chain release factor 3 [Glutamicibacter nicotianae]|uniref:peptide chain release factor 3 n=1 Tax=Glutamicibacter nicotianae TaxID=37929 RepID=UPI000EF89F7C|nr:peptide chain release factor 3 [Glutamicibacter nicotianae]